MYFHEGVGYKYNLIQPVPLPRSPDDATPIDPPEPAHVQAPYYGALVVDEFLGTSTDRTVSEIIFAEYYLSGYALYSNGELSKVLFINHEPYLSTAPTTPRPSYSISLNGMGKNYQRYGHSGFSSGGASEVTVKVLEIPYADVQTGLTWAGQSFDSGVPKGNVKADQQSVNEDVVVYASSVVLVEF